MTFSSLMLAISSFLFSMEELRGVETIAMEMVNCILNLTGEK